ncbi:MAG: 4-hydroxy-tetrahydrodipicolinate synthase [Gammaproteobacteria bacterium]
MLAGSIVALVTPMDADGRVNHEDLARLIEYHIDSGTQALVIAGTTGESATLSRDEHIELVDRACTFAAGRVPVVAGTGSNSTAQTLELSKAVDQLPVAAFLVVTPYYNKPVQEGLYQHFSLIADAVQRPVILYNVPGRTGVDLIPETTIRLASHGNIVAIKEATGELGRVEPLRDGCGPEFLLLSGDDGTSCEFMLRGGDGCISVTANVAPAQMRELCDAARSGNRDSATRIDGTLRALHEALFFESNPIPVKWAVEKLGYAGPGIRLPLTGLAAQYREGLLAAMRTAEVEVG